MISVSSLSTFLYCQRKFFLQEILGLIEIPKESLIRGTIRHKTYEQINNIEEQLIKSIKKSYNLQQLLQRYKQEHSKILREVLLNYKQELKQFNLSVISVFKETWPLILVDTETRAFNIYNFVQKNNVFGEELWNLLVPKIQSEFRIESENLDLKGVIDEVHIYPNGYVPFELKTGRTPKQGIWPEHRIQLGAYSLLLEDKFKVEIKEGFVKYLDTKKEFQVVINPFLKSEVVDIRDKIKLLLKTGELPNFCTNENKCLNCGLKDICHDSVALQQKMNML